MSNAFQAQHWLVAEAPHCPRCHSSWFRTNGMHLSFEQWERECKLCGHRFKTSESLMFTLERIGERIAGGTP